MNVTRVAALAFALLGFTMVACQTSPEPRKILNAAIDAHGGEKNIKKPRKCTLTATSKKGDSEITTEEKFDLPNRWKRTTSAVIEGKKRVAFGLFADGKLWQWEEGGDPVQSEGGVAQPSLGVLDFLLDLTADKVKLSYLGKKRVNGLPARGIRAEWEGGGGDYFFDEKTALLCEANLLWEIRPGTRAKSRTVFGDFKDFDGLKFPPPAVRRGAETMAVITAFSMRGLTVFGG
jgi:hypothetical protein